MLRELEKLFGFRTTDTTDVEVYLKRMDEMSKFDALKQNKLMAVLIKHIIELESKVSSLEAISRIEPEVKEAVEVKDYTQELSTIKADITRIKKKVYPTK